MMDTFTEVKTLCEVDHGIRMAQSDCEFDSVWWDPRPASPARSSLIGLFRRRREKRILRGQGSLSCQPPPLTNDFPLQIAVTVADNILPVDSLDKCNQSPKSPSERYLEEKVFFFPSMWMRSDSVRLANARP